MTSVNWQRAGVGVLAAVVGDEPDPGLALAGALELAGLQVAPQPQHLVRRLGQVHVDRVDLLHRGQQGGLGRLHVGPLGHRRAADAARHRRGHGRVAEVDPGRLLGGARRRHVGLPRLQGGHGVVVVLLAHRRWS